MSESEPAVSRPAGLAPGLPMRSLFQGGFLFLGCASLLGEIMSAVQLFRLLPMLRSGAMLGLVRIHFAVGFGSSLVFLGLTVWASRRRSVPVLVALLALIGLGLVIKVALLPGLGVAYGHGAVQAVRFASDGLTNRGFFLRWLLLLSPMGYRPLVAYYLNVLCNVATLSFFGYALAKQPAD